MARGTANTLIHMNAVIEVREICKTVDFHPFNRFVGAVAFPNRLEVSCVVKKHRMAIHAGFRRGNPGKGGGLHAGMAVAAIDSVVPDVVFVAELDWLLSGNVLPGQVRRTRRREHRQDCKTHHKNK